MSSPLFFFTSPSNCWSSSLGAPDRPLALLATTSALHRVNAPSSSVGTPNSLPSFFLSPLHARLLAFQYITHRNPVAEIFHPLHAVNMFATLLSAALFATLFHRVFADFTIDTPTFVQCQSSQITWTQATPPYDLLVVPADDVCGEAIRDLGNQSSLSLTWLVNLASGTQVVLFLEDASGDEAWSGTATVGASNDTSCLTNGTAGTSSVPALPSSTSSSSASPSASAFAPAGAANAGLDPVSSARAVRPFNIISALGSAILAIFAFTV